MHIAAAVPLAHRPAGRAALGTCGGERVAGVPVSKTLLIVDDNADNREILAIFLEHFGYRVLKAGNGVEGMAQAREHAPDLILMDISMPVLDGFEATELLKLDPLTAGIPIVAVTAHPDGALRTRAQGLGFTSYLIKPVPPRRLLREVERILGLGGVEEAPLSVRPLAPPHKGDRDGQLSSATRGPLSA